MIALALLAAGQATSSARAASAGPQTGTAAVSCVRAGCVTVLRVAAAPSDRTTDPAAVPPAPPATAAPPAIPDTGAGPAGQPPDGPGDADAAPAAPGNAAPPGQGAAPGSPAAPTSPRRRRMGIAASIGHFRVYEHPLCAADPCQASVSDLDSHRSFEAAVSLGPMHLAPQLEEFARSGQIELLLSGELRHGPGGATLRALHLEGVTPHAPVPPAGPHPGQARHVPGAARGRPPVAPGPRLLRA